MRRKMIAIFAAFVCAADMAVAALPAPQWISGDSADPAKPAPMLLKEFALDAKPKKAVFSVAVAGWCEVYVNGEKAGNDVLSPVTCQPDERVSSLDFSVAGMLKSGTNTLEVLLGNGWQNTFTTDAWYFASAPWVSCPKICGELNCDGRTLFVTDGAWRVYDSPIIFNGLRNGEWYDARNEGARGNLRRAKVEKYAPWGVVSPEDAVPCREFELFEPKRVLKSPQGLDIYDFGANIAGWCEIEVEGAAGAKVVLDYDESLADDGSLLGHIKQHITGRGDPRPVQHDEYTLAGRPGGEKWHPRFTYHGFRYAQVTLSGDVRLKSIRARFVHSAFERAGTLETSDATFAALQSATERSYLSNFVGIPTDCPHREKNGWTGDAQLAMETGLWNYDARASYVHFLRMMLDAQRPNGAVPCILPCSTKFGLFWGSGPAWDAILFEIPWQLYRFYGDDKPARAAYPAMKRYIAFIEGKADGNGLYDYGLGDWCPPKGLKKTPTRLTDSAYVYAFNRRAAFWAERFGEAGYAAERTAAAERIKAAFNAAFYKGDGLYDEGQLAALAAPLYFKGLCADGEEEKVAKRLVDEVRANAHKAHFGILGAKWATRVLADYGYADDAFRLFVQPEMPGWAHWLQFGDGTLRESWASNSSHNHIMFGDLSAWAYEYAAGIVPLEPGFRKIAFRPHVLKGVDSFIATHKTPFGEIRAGWRRVGGKVEFVCEAPNEIKVLRESDAGEEATVKVDFSRETGLVKPMHGVGQPPMVDKLGSWSRMHYLKEAGIPYSRLHDVGGWLGGGLFVDIPNLFPDFDADENDPANYRFAYTDSLMKALEANGVEPFFRLGVTIENFVGYKDRLPPVNILPPKDFAKWARICEHVIRHYTEGWADGMKMKIDYWEIWNEPENFPDQKDNCMWRGDWESYMRFYGVVAPYLKAKFPHLKIGGYGSCGFYAGVGSDRVAAANSSPRMEYFVECFRSFLSAARDNKWPLDFFSFHSYSAPAEALRQVRFADEKLNEYGFTADKCERIFNEWLPYVKHENLGTALQAAGVAAELIGLQNGPCDLACIYDARCGVGNYSPLFDPLTYKPHKAYYALKYFNALFRLGKTVKATSCDSRVSVIAAVGQNGGAVFAANDSEETVPFSLDIGKMRIESCRITDEMRTDVVVPVPPELPPHSFVLLSVLP